MSADRHDLCLENRLYEPSAAYVTLHCDITMMRGRRTIVLLNPSFVMFTAFETVFELFRLKKKEKFLFQFSTTSFDVKKKKMARPCTFF